MEEQDFGKPVSREERFKDAPHLMLNMTSQEYRKVLKALKRDLTAQLNAHIGEHSHRLVYARQMKWDIAATIHVEMPQELLAMLEKQGKEQAVAKLKEDLTPTQRLELAAQEGREKKGSIIT